MDFSELLTKVLWLCWYSSPAKRRAIVLNLTIVLDIHKNCVQAIFNFPRLALTEAETQTAYKVSKHPLYK